MSNNEPWPESTGNLRAPDHVLARQAGGETILLSLESEQYYGLDEIGSRVWQMIGDGRTIEATAAAITDEYEVAEDVVESDIRRLVQQLIDSELLVVDPRKPA